MTGTEALRRALSMTGNLEGEGSQSDRAAADNPWPTAQAIERGLASLDAPVVTVADLEAALIARKACPPAAAPSLAQELLLTILEARRLT